MRRILKVSRHSLDIKDTNTYFLYALKNFFIEPLLKIHMSVGVLSMRNVHFFKIRKDEICTVMVGLICSLTWEEETKKKKSLF